MSVANHLLRAKATSEIYASLTHLQTFLTTIQPIIEPWPVINDPTLDSMTVHASELYPTLGPLLEMICRNPVILVANSSSGGLADLVVQSVIKFSTRTVAGAGSNDTMTLPSPEQSWRAARMRDIFRAQQQQKQQQDGLSKKKETYAGGSGQHLPYSGHNGSSETRDDPFQDLFKVSGKELKEKEREQTLSIMANNMKTLQDEATKTELTQTAWSSLDQRRYLTERILEDSAELAGEIDDWRIVRIWILLIVWILTRLGSGEYLDTLPSEPDASPLDQDAGLCAMISSACRIVNCGDSESMDANCSHVSVNAGVLCEIDKLLKFQDLYIFETAPPQEMALRRRMAFLIGSAVASSNGLLASLILRHLLSLDNPDFNHKQDSLKSSQDTTTLLSLLSLLMSGESGTTSSSTIGELFLALLKELHGALRVSENGNPYGLRLGTVADLEGIFTKFVSLLRLNVVVTADIVYAIVVYNDPKNSAFWQSVISTVLRMVTESESTPLLTSLPAFMARLRDLSEIMLVPGLTMALNTLLATSATAAVALVSVTGGEVTMPMDMSQ
ncbi:hypothetical protein BGZ96_002493 [Linnemannia gamsii]|uniref:Uncharacterized protein n=1 Tax=Linnemannia gamsii TaxID=64522 RepID=A0ABQ7JKI3_9FUNG|nr:hypothetical protein BGZ96_002493 [Linnemannia gamsii]